MSVITLDELSAEVGSTMRGATAAQRELVQRLLEKYLQFFGASSVPRISLHNNLSPRWLGRTWWSPRNRFDTDIQLQRAVLADPRTLERVIAHEVVHHVDLTTLPDAIVACRLLRSCKYDGHGERFRELAKKVNDAVGSDFITEKSDETYAVAETKEYYLLVARLGSKTGAYIHPDDVKYAFAWGAVLPRSLRTILWLESQIDAGARMSRTRIRKFAERGRRFGDGYSVPQDSETQEQLREYYRLGRGKDDG
jgi:hypothetical protein